MRYKLIKKSNFVYPLGKPMTPHLLRYQGLAVDDGGLSRFISGAAPLMPQIWGTLDFRSFR